MTLDCIVHVVSVWGARSLSPVFSPHAIWASDLSDACVAVNKALARPSTIGVHVGLVEPRFITRKGAQ